MDTMGRILKIGTDCSGIDAPMFALKQLASITDFEIQYEFASDMNPTVRKILNAAEPTPKIIYNDVLARDNSITPIVDLYIAGFPCQSFSIQGNRLGFNSKDGCVFQGILDYLKTCKPTAFVLENVKGLVNHDKGKTLATILQALADLNSYQIEHRVISPHEVGWPQRRPRLWIVGRHKAKFGSSSNPFQWPKERPVSADALRSLLLTTEEAKRTEPNAYRCLQPSYKRSLEALKEAASSKDIDLGVGPYLLRLGMSAGRESLGSAGLSPCLVQRCEYFYLAWQGRYLTSREALRLQGFPDRFTTVTLSPPTTFKLAGNSMCVPLLVELLRPIVDALLEVKPVGSEKQNEATEHRTGGYT